MSSQQHEPKITSKNLAYSSDLPPFLAKLRGQHQQQRDSDSPDPILAARRRAARPRSASEEAEDAPLVVDEAGNTIALPSGADADADVSADDDVDGRNNAGIDSEEEKEKEKEKEREKEKIAGIGAGKKRKVGRVVGGADEDGVEDDGQKPSRSIKGREKEESSSAKNSNKPAADAKSGTKQTKKKAKKIKLSFNDDGD
ncbi:hypothetical protein F4813DRAFT_370396 [Daldinia decipiens]|uniref:uncharacterized protein n=1 Tax=Daldinia decipiens TaxID=326647 RepID=UPI0020C1CC1A|nr:uncharacterized protein F4813DRAFT_370396 [Daldinia decipiens]KAI1654575.1 hypothetical protein F4813DRAFT_370396 [Daldinia decipiens]